MAYAQISNLDFNDIRRSLIDYLRSQTDFTDYDFEGSTLRVLIDLLAYNTYYTAFNTNMVVNELFLSSATLRDNVVALAKQLGYKPKSIVAPVAYVNFDVEFTQTAPTIAYLRKGTGFNTTFDDSLYSYIVVEPQEVPVVNGIAAFRDIPIYEGGLVTNTTVVNTSLKSQKYVIENPNCDVSSIRVRVYESLNSTSYRDYELAENILQVSPDDLVYFIEEVDDERYELIFGDGVIGRKLENGEVVEVTYLITNGPDTNGAKSFIFSGIIQDSSGNSTYTTSVNVLNSFTVPSVGGQGIESVSSIKFNAPKYFGTQDRAVTAPDYAAIIRGRNIYPSVADIITYGGEEERNPEYGVVKIVIKPNNASSIPASTKQEIVRKLKPYMVGSVTPVIVDPSILFVEMKTSVFYSRSKTTQRPEEIRSKVISSVEEYLEQSDTEKFNGKFRYSKFIGVIDDADRSINSNDTSILMRKDFIPLINTTTYYELCYQNEFDYDCDNSVVSSTGFTVSEYPNDTVYFEDRDGKIVLYKLDRLTLDKVVLNENIGTVDYKEGEIKISSLTILKGSFSDNRIQVRVQPLSNDLNALRNVYLDVDLSNSTFTAYPE